MNVELQNKITGMSGQIATSNTKERVLPLFSSLAFGSLAANAPVIGFLLIRDKLGLAGSVLAGYALGLAVYGFLYLFVTKGMDTFIDSFRGVANPPVSGSLGGFIVMLTLKFIALGVFVYCLLHLLSVNIIGLAVGAVITQFAVTAIVLKHMRRHKSVDHSQS